MRMVKKFVLFLLILPALSVSSAIAIDVISVKTIGMDLARDIANETVLVCREKGYQVSAVVVDRGGNLRAALRDDLAARFTLQIAEEKANVVVMSGSNSGNFRDSRGDIRPELNHIDGIIMMRGGLPITVAGSRVGAVGVSGAPGGDIDEACAAEALEKLAERIEFAEE